MDIRDCNEYRTRMMQAKPRTCLQCGLGPCRYSTGELSVANTDLDGNTPRIENKHNLLDATKYGIAAVDFGREISPIKASPPTPKLVVHAIAMERLEAGEMIRVETDLHTGMTYARKA